MQFNEKLEFLLRFTSTTNRQLASALMVDPSFISRLRQGKRNVPNKTNYYNDFANFFAKKFTSEYQRNTLAEVIGQSKIKSITSVDSLAIMIAEWLSTPNSKDLSGIAQFIHNVDENSHQATSKQSTSNEVVAEKQESHAYYGNKGKRKALSDFYELLCLLPNPCKILVSTDEDLTWLNESSQYLKSLQNYLLDLTNRGFSFCRILPKIYTSDDPIDSVNRWLPIYMEGFVETYYYQKMRDNLYRRTLIVAPGIASVCSSSIGNKSSSDLTFLNVDEGMANAAAREFNDYLSRCVRICKVYTHENGSYMVPDCLQKFLLSPGNRITKHTTLPTYTSPLETLRFVFGSSYNDIEIFNNLIELNEKNLAVYEQTDIITLATVDDLKTNKVLCPLCKLVANTKEVYYTIPMYIAHLKNIIRLLKKYPKYNVHISSDLSNNNTACVIENYFCYIIRMKDPMMIFEINEINFVTAVNDYLLNIINNRAVSISKEKEITIEAISKLITRLESM